MPCQTSGPRTLILFVVLVVTAWCNAVPIAVPGHPTTAATVSADAQALLDRLREAYGKLETLELAGTVSADFDLAGEATKQSESFTAAFKAPMHFVHDMRGDVVLASTTVNRAGAAATAGQLVRFNRARNQFMKSNGPAGRGERLPRDFRTILRDQNLSLLLAVSKDPARELTLGATDITRGPDQALDGSAHPVLLMRSEAAVTSVLLDPGTGLIRRVVVDVTDQLRAQDIPDVKRAVITIDYSTALADRPIDPARLAFVPPAGATESQSLDRADSEVTENSLEGREAPAMKLIGQPAPPLELKDLSGAVVSVESLKGSVVVLDFWATWCGPCREGLPHLASIHRDLSARGVRVIAVNLNETAEQVKSFLAAQSIDLPVVLDSDGAVAKSYRVEGIPQTVLIDRAGVLRKVFVGFGPGSAERLDEAVAELLEE